MAGILFIAAVAFLIILVTIQERKRANKQK